MESPKISQNKIIAKVPRKRGRPSKKDKELLAKGTDTKGTDTKDTEGDTKEITQNLVKKRGRPSKKGSLRGYAI